MSNNKSDLMDASFFDDVLLKFYQADDKNEELYNNLYAQYKNSQNVGFSLGTSRGSTEIAKVLSSLRSNGITAASALFAAKKSIVELELKKKQQTIDEQKTDDGKEWIRSTIAAIQLSNNKANQKSIDYEPIFPIEEVKPIKIKKTSTHTERNKLDSIIDAKLKKGEIKLTSNEKVMALDFKDKIEPVLDSVSGEIKIVYKDTNKEVTNYPLERVKLGKVIEIDNEKQIAFCEGGKTIRVEKVK
jgi:hypothetical protein